MVGVMILRRMRMTENNWILCDEQMPEYNTTVLVTVTGTDFIVFGADNTIEPYVTLGTYIENDGWYGADGYPMMVAPTAWMPLPKPYGKNNQ